MLLYPSMVLALLLAHHQVVSHCSLAKPDSQMKSKDLALQDYSYSLCGQTWMCLMAEISARSSVSSLRSLSVHLNPWLFLGLTTLVAAFLNSSKRGSYAWYCSWSPGTHSSDCDVMIPDKEECWQHALDLLIQPLRWDKSRRHILASSTLKDSTSYTS